MSKTATIPIELPESIAAALELCGRDKIMHSFDPNRVAIALPIKLRNHKDEVWIVGSGITHADAACDALSQYQLRLLDTWKWMKTKHKDIAALLQTHQRSLASQAGEGEKPRG